MIFKSLHVSVGKTGCMKASLILISLLLLVGCRQRLANNHHYIEGPPELIIYCENGMVAPVMEITAWFESHYKCIIRIQNGNARDLTGQIIQSGKGDIFIPDSYYGLQQLRMDAGQIILDSIFLGTNSLILIVPPGNPEMVNGSLCALINNNHVVMIANPESSSLGHETRNLLEQDNLYHQVIANVSQLAPDSRRLIRSVNSNEATLAIDWRSSYLTNHHYTLVDTISLHSAYQSPRVYASILKHTENPGLAYSFMAFLSSPQGIELFAKYGITRARNTAINLYQTVQ